MLDMLQRRRACKVTSSVVIFDLEMYTDSDSELVMSCVPLLPQVTGVQTIRPGRYGPRVRTSSISIIRLDMIIVIVTNTTVWYW